MNDITKTLGGVVIGAGLVVGASLVSSADTVATQEIVDVNDTGESIEKVEVIVKQEETKDVVKFAGTLEQINKIITSYDKLIAQHQARIDEATAKKNEYIVIRDTMQKELDKLPARKEAVVQPVVESDIIQ